MKIKSLKLSICITLLSTILIITIGYQVLAYAGASFLKNDNEITRLSTENATTYVFYSQSEDEITLYPWTYNYDTTPFFQYFGSKIYASDVFDIWKLYDSLTFYFYRMVPEDILIYLYEEDITLSQRMNYVDVEYDLTVKSVNNELIFFYSKDLIINDQTLNLSFAFNQDCQLLSFQIKPSSSAALSDEDVNSGKQFLTDYINSAKSDSISYIYYDIINQAGLCDSYSLKNTDSDLNSYIIKEVFDTGTSEKNEELKLSLLEKEEHGDAYTSIDDALTKNSSYQLVDTDNEFLIILLENNIVLHYDPTNSMISGFNLSESYMSMIK